MKNQINRQFLSVFLIVVVGLMSCTEQPATGTYDRAQQKSSYVIDTLRTAQQVPGLQLAVWKNGETVMSKGFGFADLEQRVPVDSNTKLRIGSVSKTVTSAAVGKLLEEGQLDLDAPVQEYVEYFPEKEYTITSRQVAGHLAGIRHYRGDEFLLDERFENVEESLEIFEEDTLLFEPETDYSYSSYGWNLLSAVVEEAAGEDFLSVMQDEVFEPIGMRETVPEYTDSLIANRTSYYEMGENDEVINAPYVDNSYKWAGGGFVGTTEDLLRFGEAIFWSDYLDQETVDTLIASLELNDGEETNYGIGWRNGTDEDGRQWYGHSGGSVGGTTQFVVFPEEEVIVAVVANMGGVAYRDAHLKIAEFFIEETVE